MRRQPKLISDQGFARPAPAYFPYRDHRTMAEVLEDEAADERAGQEWARYAQAVRG